MGSGSLTVVVVSPSVELVVGGSVDDVVVVVVVVSSTVVVVTVSVPSRKTTSASTQSSTTSSSSAVLSTGSLQSLFDLPSIFSKQPFSGVAIPPSNRSFTLTMQAAGSTGLAGVCAAR